MTVAAVILFARPEGALADANGKRMTSHVRTTEVIVKSGAGWRYVVDHASIGLPPPKAAAKAGAKATQKK